MEYVDGNRYHFDAKNLFFSTTDTKGVIRRTSRVLDSLSRHSSEGLAGSPYNIIWHDDTPAGVFELMWNGLEQGCSFCIYMFSRAKDRRSYWVLATIAPLTDGHLSVRVRPANRAMFTPVKEIHTRVRAVERVYAEEGHGRREIVEYEAALLAEGLTKLQHYDLHNFVRVALSRELALLVVERVRVPPRAEPGNPMSAVLQVVTVIGRDTDELVYQLGGYQESINGPESWVTGVCPVIDRADHVDPFMGKVISPDAESSAPTVSERVRERGAQAVEVLRQSNSSPMAFYRTASEVHFRSSMMHLHTLTAGIFAAAVLDDQKGRSGDAIDDLVEAMFSDLEELMPSCQKTTNLAECLEGDLRSVVSNLDRVKWPFQRWIRAFRDEGVQVLTEGVDTEAVLSRAIATDEQGFPETASLAELAAKTHDVIMILDEPVTRQRVAVVCEALSHLEE